MPTLGDLKSLFATEWRSGFEAVLVLAAFLFFRWGAKNAEKRAERERELGAAAEKISALLARATIALENTEAGRRGAKLRARGDPPFGAGTPPASGGGA
jgi:hypothetical protein